ncbi:MAG TPA: MoxR family ATPase [Steroidobacteraceae bacterium]|nr:MoxR family ATPase [Steroidobacteraceae bacterium]
MSALQDLETRIQERLHGTVIGMRDLIRALVIAIVARGHVLVEGPPGLGKTLLGKSLAAALSGRFRRIQGTADLMPADITGVHVFDETAQKFVLHPGPIFTDVLLVDEINRTGPKTQSALLEAMAERQVTIDRNTYTLPPGFLVIATQNPHEFEGTFPLPESQLDRFMMRIAVGFPGADDEAAVLARYGTIAAAAAVAGKPAAGDISIEQIGAARECADGVHVSPEVLTYILGIAAASREHAQIALGLSTRGALSLLLAGRVAAGLRGSEFVTPDDVKLVVPWVVPHRLTLSSEAALEGRTDRELTRALLEQVPVPR